jgi:2-oxoglutarate ferredoxin oxidoreductase subunit beta
VSEGDVLVHDETNRALAALLASLQPPQYPEVLGVLFCNPAEPYEQALAAQAAAVTGPTDLGTLLRAGRTWTVTG